MTTRRIAPALCLLSALPWIGSGCTEDPAERDARIAAACGACHALPPADVLPRESWRPMIEHMAGLARDPHPVVGPPTAFDVEEAVQLVGLLTRVLPWETGWRVLDVGCGAGRHAQALAAAGARAVGLDLSAGLLRRARQVTRGPLVRADMRRLPIRPRSMDLTVNLFTSFGYFASDHQHQSALSEMLGTVRPGGHFVIDFLNADHVRATLGKHHHEQAPPRPVPAGRRSIRRRHRRPDCCGRWGG